MTVYLVDNFLPASALDSAAKADKTVLERVHAAQRDHVSINFKEGIVRMILPDVTEDVVGEEFSVREGSRTQYWASLIANEYNLQPFLYKKDDGTLSLVIVSQLGGPISDVEEITRRLDKMKIC